MPLTDIDGQRLGDSVADKLGNRNLIINGSMAFDQRNAGASITPANAQYLVDRWKVGATQSSKFTAQQSTIAPTEFKNSLLLTSSSAFTPGASDEFEIIQFIEGNNVAHANFGTSSAQALTLSFYVRSSLTGTFGGAIYNGAANRSYPFTYTISAADTFELKTVTFAGDTSGTWATDHTAGINVLFSLGAGSSKLGTPGAWTGSFKPGATGQTNLVATSGATLYLTGVQLEVGNTATPFEHRSYSDEFARCQRYFETSYPVGTAPGATQTHSPVTLNAKANSFRDWQDFKVTKRVSPTMKFYAPDTGTIDKLYNADDTAEIAIIADSASHNGARVSSGGTAAVGDLIRWQYTADAEI